MSDTPEDLFFEKLKEKKAEEIQVRQDTGPRPVTQRNLFENPESHPVLLDAALLKTFGVEWFPWLAETLFHEIEQTFKTSIADVNRLKIMTVQTLHVTDSFWEEWEIFEKVINSLNNIPPMLGVMQPPDAGMLLAGVDIVNQVRKEEFSEEVARYTAACFLHDNVFYAPPPCDFAQLYISQPMYKCKDCGKTRSALPPFKGYCPSCTEIYSQEHPFTFEPSEEAIKKNKGQNIEYFLSFDPEPTKKRFEEFDKADPTALPGMIKEEAVDIQAAKLISAVDYKNSRIKQLDIQLTGIRPWLESA